MIHTFVVALIVVLSNSGTFSVQTEVTFKQKKKSGAKYVCLQIKQAYQY